MNQVRHVSTSIACSFSTAYDYISNPLNLPEWASGLSSSIQQVEGKWVADSPMGKVSIVFTQRNEFGVLDHDVTLASGLIMSNPFRVIRNGDGCVLIFSVLRRPGMSDEEFSTDIQHVEKDLSALKKILETA